MPARLSWSLLLGLAALAWAPESAAELMFEVSYQDAPNEGFFDETAAPRAEGNPGETFGEQRRFAFEAALDVWAPLLDSPVAIRVEARFDGLPCEATSAVLGGARPSSVLSGFVGAPVAHRFYAAALADRLAGYDLEPQTSDILANFNAAIDLDCVPGRRWDYSITELAAATSFFNTVLHELAHGLGFTNLVSASSGRSDLGFGPFDALLFDAALRRYWDQLTPEERVQSAARPRRLSWAGSAANQAALRALGKGLPYVDVMSDAGRTLLELVSEVPGGARPSRGERGGPLLIWDARAGCEPPDPPLSAVVLVRDLPECEPLADRLRRAQRGGASAALVESATPSAPPIPPDLQGAEFALALLAISHADAAVLEDLGEASVALRALSERPLGTDVEGRLLLNATAPSVGGSSVSHFDPIARRDQVGEVIGLLMEPSMTDPVPNAVDPLTLALLHDIGWAAAECGNGVLEPGEGCDDGVANDDAEVDACRQDCRVARCGDGVVDSWEQCDLGPALGDCPRDCGIDPESPLHASHPSQWPAWSDPTRLSAPLDDLDAGCADSCPDGLDGSGEPEPEPGAGPGPSGDPSPAEAGAGPHGDPSDAGAQPAPLDGGALPEARGRGIDERTGEGCACAVPGPRKSSGWMALGGLAAAVLAAARRVVSRRSGLVGGRLGRL